jgi:hypothetical protein
MREYLLYIDPGSGSYLVQVIVAAVVGIAVFFRNIRDHIRTFFFRPRNKKTPDQTPANDTNQES